MSDEVYDLAVIGAGAIGLTTALAARRRHPRWSIAVLDRGPPGGGATRRSAAIAAAYAADAALRPLVAASARCYRAGALAPFARPLAARVVVPRAGLGQLRSRLLAGGLREAGEGEREALAGLTDGAAWGSGDAVLSAAGAVQVIDVAALAARVLGPELRIELRPRAAALAIAAERRGYRVETAPPPQLRATRIVIATGPWAPPPVAGAPPPAGFAVKRVAALHLDGLPGRAPAVFWPAADCFLLPERGRHLFSFRRSRWLRPGEDPAAGFAAADLAEGVAALAPRGGPLLGAVSGGRAHADAYAAGRLPRVEARRSHPRLAWVWGGSGSGVALAPALAVRALAAIA